MSFCSQILGFCECGRGGRVSKPGNRFINGHQNRGKNNPMFGKHPSEETIQKNRESNSGENNPNFGKTCPEHSKRMSGENNPRFGKHQSEETIQKISESNLGENNPAKRPEVRAKMRGPRPGARGENSPMFGKPKSEKTKRKNREHAHAMLGENNPNWQGGISFEPYCFKFDEPKKEKTREDFGYTCFWCGITQEERMAEQRAEGKRPCKLHVHHIDYNKNQGCNGVKWKLVPLCDRCHGKIDKNNEKEMEKFSIEKLYFREFSTMCKNSTILFR